MKETRKEKIYNALCDYDGTHKIYDLYELADYINRRIRMKKTKVRG